MSKLTQNIETLEEASKITKKEMPENTFFDTKALATNKEFEEILDTKKVEILITGLYYDETSGEIFWEGKKVETFDRKISWNEAMEKAKNNGCHLFSGWELEKFLQAYCYMFQNWKDNDGKKWTKILFL